MKIKDILLEQEGERRDILKDIWDTDYSGFYQEIGELVDEIIVNFSNNPNAKKAYQYFTKEFSGYEDGKISNNDRKLVYTTIDAVIDNDSTLKSIVAGLNKFKAVMDDVKVYFDETEIDANDQVDNAVEYNKDPYKYYGVSRSDF